MKQYFDLLTLLREVFDFRFQAKTFNACRLNDVKKFVVCVDTDSKLCRAIHFDRKINLKDIVFLDDWTEFHLYAYSYFEALKVIMGARVKDVLFYYHGNSDGMLRELVTGPQSIVGDEWMGSESMHRAVLTGVIEESGFKNSRSGIASCDMSAKNCTGKAGPRCLSAS